VWRDALLGADSGAYTVALDPPAASAITAHAAAESLLAVIGPDDLPALDPARTRENPRQALVGLWLFKAAIAAVHLVMPGPLAQS
jgi:hypothetical protein